MKSSRMLIVEDNRPLALAISALAERQGWVSATVPTLTRAGQELEGSEFDLVLLDIGLPDGNSLDYLRANPGFPGVPVAIMTAHGEIENAIVARQLGVTRFFDKPIDFEELKTFLNEFSDRGRPAGIMSRTPVPPGPVPATALIGAAPEMRPVFQLIAQACASSVPLVVRGEIGAGKSHVVRLIQQHSIPRAGHSLQALAETDAAACHEAVIRAAGTSLVIENLPNLSRHAQTALLQALEHPEIRPVRLLATVDEEGLHARVLDESLLPELYYRLQVLEIRLPPLRERLEDLPALASYFLGELSGHHCPQLSPELIRVLRNRSWPGNLHELRNLIKFLVVSHPDLKCLTPDCLPPYFREQEEDDECLMESPFDRHLDEWLDRQFESAGVASNYKDLHASLERRLLKRLLRRHDNKPSRLAREMNINRVTLRKKLREPGG